jgi:hypothetical protein
MEGDKMTTVLLERWNHGRRLMLELCRNSTGALRCGASD